LECRGPLPHEKRPTSRRSKLCAAILPHTEAPAAVGLAPAAGGARRPDSRCPPSLLQGAVAAVAVAVAAVPAAAVAAVAASTASTAAAAAAAAKFSSSSSEEEESEEDGQKADGMSDQKAGGVRCAHPARADRRLRALNGEEIKVWVDLKPRDAAAAAVSRHLKK
jgi:hypothetical protein